MSRSPSIVGALAALAALGGCPGGEVSGGGPSGGGSGGPRDGGSGGTDAPGTDERAAPSLAARLFAGLERIELGSTYGQYWECYGLHDGVDFLAPEGTPVRALEAGVVGVYEPNGYYTSVPVWAHGADPERDACLVYVHLDDVTKAPGDPVEAGETLGVVVLPPDVVVECTDPPQEVYAHLHLERARFAAFSDPGVFGVYTKALRACGSPLEGLEGFVDDVGPALLELPDDGAPTICDGFAALYDHAGQRIAPEDAAGAVDVVFRISDRTRADAALATGPLRVRLTARAADDPEAQPAVLGEIDLSLPIWDDAQATSLAESLFQLGDARSLGHYETRDFYVVATRSPTRPTEPGTNQPGPLAAAVGGWEVPPLGGDFVVELTLTDHGGNITTRAFELHLGP